VRTGDGFMTMHRKISVIIPARNESKLISGTLNQFESLKKIWDLEIIVSDGGSTDDTCTIAAGHGARIVYMTSDSQTIGEARNDGAKLARGEILFFFDADTRMMDPQRFFTSMIATFDDSQIVAAIPRMSVFPEQRKASDLVFQFFYNSAVASLIALRQPVSGGQCQVVRATAFRKVGGYPEGVAHAEDTAMLRLIKNQGRIVFRRNLTILESPRRYRTWGYWRLLSVAARSFLYNTFVGKEMLTEWERVD